MKSSALYYFDHGFNVLVVNGKQPMFSGWPDQHPDRAQITSWWEQYPSYNIGMICTYNPSIDADILDIKVSNKMSAFIHKIYGITLPKRVGQAPKFAIPCMNPKGLDPFKKQKTKIYVDSSNAKITHAIEILATGQMLVLDGTHPGTKQPYTWNMRPTEDNMIVLTQRIIEQIFEEFERLGDEKVSAGEWAVKGESTIAMPAAAGQPKIKDRKLPNVEYTEQEMEVHMSHIPALPHDDWMKMGMGLHWQYQGSDVGKRLWTKYSKEKYTAAEFNEHEINTRYPTFNKDRTRKQGCTIGTVLDFKNKAIAKANVPTFTLPDNNKAQVNNSAAPATWYDGWYYMSSRHSFIKPSSGSIVKTEPFNFMNLSNMLIDGIKGKASVHVLQLNYVSVVDGCMYRPDAYDPTTLIGSYNNQTYVNTYNPYIPQGVPPEPTMFEHPQCIEDYLHRLIPDLHEYNIVLTFLAYIVQNPGCKINWAPVLLGVEGTGKTTILEIMKCMLGGNNVRPVSSIEFTDSFNNFVEGSVFNFVEEVRISGSNRHLVLDKVKELITNDMVSVNHKGVNRYTAKNVTSYMLATNHADALPINDANRRYCVIQTLLDSSPEQFVEIYLWIKTRAHEIKAWFLSIDIPESFDAEGRAPITESTQSMIGNTEDLLVQSIQDQIDKDKPLMNMAMLSFSVLVDALYAAIPGSEFNTKFAAQVRAKLLTMNYTKYTRQKQVSFTGKRHVLYIPDANLHKKLGLQPDSVDTAIDRAKRS